MCMHVGHKTRSVDDGNLVREVREIRHSGYVPYLLSRRFDFARSGLDTFVKKRNFDEIDRSSMPFPYATKRFYHLYGTNDIDTPV
ncbi:hypothetical protein HF086_007875 [Spodoptera exigua]|uniref:Uncharacterized protein n=1 Tax=Spodoptera exigua TaxID=7107 RepID=A0A922MXR9_SPOEX|nr:hypothetical protein HF086_007875 [Spodoptera exigua]